MIIRILKREWIVYEYLDDLNITLSKTCHFPSNKCFENRNIFISKNQNDFRQNVGELPVYNGMVKGKEFYSVMMCFGDMEHFDINKTFDYKV